MASPTDNRWIKFLRNYGPIPANDNMYDETIQRALKRNRIQPLILPTQYLEELLANFRSDHPKSQILTGTAGDGKTYHCREVWLALGGSEVEWAKGLKVQTLALGDTELVVVKDLSELRDEESAELLQLMAEGVCGAAAEPRFYLIAANHGQLLEKLKAAPQTVVMQAMAAAIEELLVTGESTNSGVRLDLKDLSQAPATKVLGTIIDAITSHPGWEKCEGCPAHGESGICPIFENRRRILGEYDGGILRRRLTSLVELSEQNGVHFPVRQLLALTSNIVLGHPDAPDGLMNCASVPEIVSRGRLDKASAYRNVFGENLKKRAEKSDLFKKLNAFGIGGETSNRVDSLLVYGADDPILKGAYNELVLGDPVYGGTSAFTQAQRAYLEGRDINSRENFLPMLRSQRQRLFLALPEDREAEFDLWDLTVFRYGGQFLEAAASLKAGKPLPRRIVPMVIRGLNRVFTGMLVQNQDELVLATSGSHSQARTSPLLDELISVPRQGGEEVALVTTAKGGIALTVRLSRGDEPGLISLALTPTRFEFLGRVAEGALPSSFSLECHEDLLAFKAKLLSATERRRVLDGDETASAEELVLRFLEIGSDGRASPRRVTLRTQ